MPRFGNRRYLSGFVAATGIMLLVGFSIMVATQRFRDAALRVDLSQQRIGLIAQVRARLYDGVATHYDAKDGDGACLYGPSPDLMVAAMNHTDYETSKACGAYILVRAAGGASVTVRITNECPLPCAPGQLDLSKEAFAKLAGLSAGRIPITWSLLSPSTSDTVSVRYKTGSSRHWCGIQALGHRNPLARLEVRSGSGWTRLTRTEYNYFLSPDGTGCGGVTAARMIPMPSSSSPAKISLRSPNRRLHLPIM